MIDGRIAYVEFERAESVWDAARLFMILAMDLPLTCYVQR
jgi:hypothetical protein